MRKLLSSLLTPTLIAAPALAQPAMMDLHSHSYCSDGLKTPEALVRQAKAVGVTHLAITDHDTVACLPRALREAERLAVNLIPGIEMGAEDDSLHILGLGIDPQSPYFQNSSRSVGGAHIERLVKMIERLAERGLPVDLKNDIVLPRLNAERAVDGLGPVDPAEAEAASPQALAARVRGHILLPDLARAMVARGYVSSVGEAFGKHIGDEAPNSVKLPMKGPSFREVISEIKASGGIAILAHPFTVYKYKPFPRALGGRLYESFEELADALIEAGLDGFEHHRPGPPAAAFAADLARVEAIAARHEDAGREILLMPGSDYHGYDQGGIGPRVLGAIPMPAGRRDRVIQRLFPQLAQRDPLPPRAVSALRRAGLQTSLILSASFE